MDHRQYCQCYLCKERAELAALRKVEEAARDYYAAYCSNLGCPICEALDALDRLRAEGKA